MAAELVSTRRMSSRRGGAHPEFNWRYLVVTSWLRKVAPGGRVWIRDCRVWLEVGDGNDPLIPHLRAAGFKRSAGFAVYWYHTGLRWNAGDRVWMPEQGYALRPFGEGRERGVQRLGHRYQMPADGRGIRGTLFNADRLVLVTIDWERTDWAAVLREMAGLAVELQDEGGVEFWQVKGWRVRPARAADFTARSLEDLDGILSVTAKRNAAAVLRRDPAKRRALEAAELKDAVHDPSLSLEDKGRLELRRMRGVRSNQFDARITLGLLRLPGLHLPAGIMTVAGVERMTGPTPVL